MPDLRTERADWQLQRRVLLSDRLEFFDSDSVSADHILPDRQSRTDRVPGIFILRQRGHGHLYSVYAGLVLCCRWFVGAERDL